MSDGNVIQGAFECNVHEGRVVLTIRQTGKDPVYMAFDPGGALEVADVIAKASYNAKYGKDRPVLIGLGDMVIEQKRVKLNNRCNIMLKSMLTEGKSNQVIVKNLIDACLAEVT
jgi:hypothetical protein